MSMTRKKPATVLERKRFWWTKKGKDGRSRPRGPKLANDAASKRFGKAKNKDPRSVLSPTMQVELTHDPGEPRVFARLISFDFGCPKCGRLYQLTEPGRARSHATPQYRVWDPRSARFCCRYCSLVCLLGIVAWPVVRKGLNYTEATPPDIVPTPREAAELRVQASFWAKPVDAKLPRKPINIVRRLDEMPAKERHAHNKAWWDAWEKRREAEEEEKDAQE